MKKNTREKNSKSLLAFIRILYHIKSSEALLHFACITYLICFMVTLNYGRLVFDLLIYINLAFNFVFIFGIFIFAVSAQISKLFTFIKKAAFFISLLNELFLFSALVVTCFVMVTLIYHQNEVSKTNLYLIIACVGSSFLICLIKFFFLWNYHSRFGFIPSFTNFFTFLVLASTSIHMGLMLSPSQSSTTAMLGGLFCICNIFLIIQKVQLIELDLNIIFKTYFTTTSLFLCMINFVRNSNSEIPLYQQVVIYPIVWLIIRSIFDQYMITDLFKSGKEGDKLRTLRAFADCLKCCGHPKTKRQFYRKIFYQKCLEQHKINCNLPSCSCRLLYTVNEEHFERFVLNQIVEMFQPKDRELSSSMILLIISILLEQKRNIYDIFSYMESADRGRNSLKNRFDKIYLQRSIRDLLEIEYKTWPQPLDSGPKKPVNFFRVIQYYDISDRIRTKLLQLTSLSLKQLLKIMAEKFDFGDAEKCFVELEKEEYDFERLLKKAKYLSNDSVVVHLTLECFFARYFNEDLQRAVKVYSDVREKEHKLTQRGTNFMSFEQERVYENSFVLVSSLGAENLIEQAYGECKKYIGYYRDQMTNLSVNHILIPVFRGIHSLLQKNFTQKLDRVLYNQFKQTMMLHQNGFIVPIVGLFKFAPRIDLSAGIKIISYWKGVSAETFTLILDKNLSVRHYSNTFLKYFSKKMFENSVNILKIIPSFKDVMGSISDALNHFNSKILPHSRYTIYKKEIECPKGPHVLTLLDAQFSYTLNFEMKVFLWVFIGNDGSAEHIIVINLDRKNNAKFFKKPREFTDSSNSVHQEPSNRSKLIEENHPAEEKPEENSAAINDDDEMSDEEFQSALIENRQSSYDSQNSFDQESADPPSNEFSFSGGEFSDYGLNFSTTFATVSNSIRLKKIWMIVAAFVCLLALIVLSSSSFNFFIETAATRTSLTIEYLLSLFRMSYYIQGQIVQSSLNKYPDENATLFTSIQNFTSENYNILQADQQIIYNSLSTEMQEAKLKVSNLYFFMVKKRLDISLNLTSQNNYNELMSSKPINITNLPGLTATYLISLENVIDVVHNSFEECTDAVTKLVLMEMLLSCIKIFLLIVIAFLVSWFFFLNERVLGRRLEVLNEISQEEVSQRIKNLQAMEAVLLSTSFFETQFKTKMASNSMPTKNGLIKKFDFKSPPKTVQILTNPIFFLLVMVVIGTECYFGSQLFSNLQTEQYLERYQLNFIAEAFFNFNVISLSNKVLLVHLVPSVAPPLLSNISLPTFDISTIQTFYFNYNYQLYLPGITCQLDYINTSFFADYDFNPCEIYSWHQAINSTYSSIYVYLHTKLQKLGSSFLEGNTELDFFSFSTIVIFQQFAFAYLEHFTSMFKMTFDKNLKTIGSGLSILIIFLSVLIFVLGLFLLRSSYQKARRSFYIYKILGIHQVFTRRAKLIK